MALTVNGERIEDIEIREEAARLRPELDPEEWPDPLEREAHLREVAKANLVERLLIRQEALKDPTPVPPELVERALQEMRSHVDGPRACDPRASDDDVRRDLEARLRVDRFLDRITRPLSPPRHKEIVEYYKKHREGMWLPESIRASHIVKNVDETTTEEAAREAIELARQELASGAPFAEVADRHSDCKGNGGDLGHFTRGQMVEEFDAVVFGLPEGTVSEVFRTSFGFHLAVVHERRPEGIAPLASVERRLQELLFRHKQERAVANVVERLRAKAEVKEVRGARQEG